MGPFARKRSTAVLIVACLVLAACGSTVSSDERAALRADDELGASGGSGSGPGGTGDARSGADADGAGGGGSSAGGSSAGGSGAGSAGGSGQSAAGGGGPGAAGGGGGAGGPVGPGVTDTTIKIGLAYDKNAGALNQAYGFAGIGQIDQKRAYDLIVEHINATGGVAGRKLEPVYHATDQLEGKTNDQNAQEMCATWTQDNKVFASWSGATFAALPACLTKAGVVQVGSSGGQAYRETFEKYPYLVDTGLALETLGRLLVDQLAPKGFYAKARDEAGPAADIKIGLMAHDRPPFRAGAAALKAALADRGLELSEEVYITKAETADQVPQEVNAVRAAVLRFKEQNITHVHFLQTNNAFAGLTFWQQAESLRYYPRYGLTSNDAAQALATTLDSASGQGSAARQFEMALGVGWTPLWDVPRADYSGAKESSTLRLCKKVVEPASSGGYDDSARNKEVIAANLCDAAFYFRAAVNAGGPVPNTASWLAGVSRVDNLGSAFTFRFRTTKQRDATGAFRNTAFDAGCNCFHYTAGQRPI